MRYYIWCDLSNNSLVKKITWTCVYNNKPIKQCVSSESIIIDTSSYFLHITTFIKDKNNCFVVTLVKKN